jgi:hypothetical protein
MTDVCVICNKDIPTTGTFAEGPNGKIHIDCSIATCSVCKNGIKPIDDHVESNDQHFHAGCFICSNCKKPLSSYQLGSDGSLLCKGCFQSAKQANATVVGKCCGCSKDVTSIQRAFTVDTDNGPQLYHQECFICFKCKGTLANGCTVFENQLHCGDCLKRIKEDFLKEQAREQAANPPPQPKPSIICHECKQPITSQALRALDREWHVDCVKCFRCKNAMSNKLFPIDNEPHCESCAREISQAAAARQQAQSEALNNSAAVDDLAQKVVQASLNSDSAPKSDVTCNLCKQDIFGAYRELNNLAFCMPCAQKIQQNIGVYLIAQNLQMNLFLTNCSLRNL